MSRGRKKIEGANNEVFSMRISKSQKEVLEKNKFIKNDIVNYVRNYLSSYVMDKKSL